MAAVETLPEVRGARPGVDRRHVVAAPRHLEALPGGVLAPARTRPDWQRRLARASRRWRYPLAVYALSRALYLIIAVVDTLIQHWSLRGELANWDGVWYLQLAVHGYPHHVLATQDTLGFFPLYPLMMWVLGNVGGVAYVVSGVAISLITGAIATVLISRLARGWWGEAASRRAVLFFCLFPGSIVFSMVYTEGLLLCLVAGCLLALQERRWLLAGILAGLSTAVGPVAVAIIPACAAVAFQEIRRHGWHDREARRALLAPLLAPVGIAAFGIFLWAWTGSPLASYTTQHQKTGWKEGSSPFALYYQARKLVQEIFGHHSLHHPGINLNLPAGLLGAAFLAFALLLLWRNRNVVSLGALVWTAGVAVLTITSDQTPPNARMLICAFPAVLVVAKELQGKAVRRLIVSSTVLLVAMSFVSFVGTGLRP
jgi:Gpi18-like mannosyltransferase